MVFAFVYDTSHDFIDKLNQELVVAERIDTDEMDEARHFLKRLLRGHINENKEYQSNRYFGKFPSCCKRFFGW